MRWRMIAPYQPARKQKSTKQCSGKTHSELLYNRLQTSHNPTGRGCWRCSHWSQAREYKHIQKKQLQPHEFLRKTPQKASSPILFGIQALTDSSSTWAVFASPRRAARPFKIPSFDGKDDVQSPTEDTIYFICSSGIVQNWSLGIRREVGGFCRNV